MITFFTQIKRSIFVSSLAFLFCAGILFSQEFEPPTTGAEANDLKLPESWQDIVAFVEMMKGENEDPLFKRDPLMWTIHQKQCINRWTNCKLNYDFALGYSSLYQKATAGGPPTDAMGDDYEMWGVFSLTPDGSKHPSIIAIKAEGRSRYASLTPGELGPAIGSLWPTTATYSRQNFSLIQFWWEYHLVKDQLGFRVGKMDVTDFIDIYQYIVSDYGFINGGLTANMTIPFPANSLTFQLSGNIGKNGYFMATIADINAEKTSLSLDTFFTEGEYFTSFEFGYVPTYSNGKGRYHLSAWYVDSQKKTGRRAGQGVTLSLEQQIGEHFHPFVRYGYGHGNTAPCEQMMNIGFGIEKPFCRESDLFLMGYVWGRPFDNDKRDQHMFETLYRIQVFPNWQLSPDFQLIINPSDNNKDDVIAVLGLRLRIEI
jgi:porin